MVDVGTSVSDLDVADWFDDEDDDHSPALPVEAVDPAKKYATSQLRVVRETKDYQLDYLKHALRPGEELIDISPTYQRRLRWPNRKKSLLIESLLLNIPVPPIFLYERDYNSYEAIDGRQRLHAITTFLADGFKLSGLEYWAELNGKRFRDLPDVLQKGLLRRSLPAVVLLAETQRYEVGELDVRRILFDRLNTGGIKLNPQELRNALYPGRLNTLLIRLARAPLFTEIWNIPGYTEGEEDGPSAELLRNSLFSTMADSELVLRFFALKDAIDRGVVGSLRSILDGYMEANVNLDEIEASELSEKFHSCLAGLHSIFGAETFRLPESGRLSRPLYDALMIAFSQTADYETRNRKEDITAALHEALANKDTYDVLVGRGNTIQAVHDRVELAGEILMAGLRK
ncbi:DUF262 domain-containing protein [Nocardia sp. NPDC003999]